KLTCVERALSAGSARLLHRTRHTVELRRCPWKNGSRTARSMAKLLPLGERSHQKNYFVECMAGRDGAQSIHATSRKWHRAALTELPLQVEPRASRERRCRVGADFRIPAVL